jgi:ssDNA-binding Zn-finger/Zn-ribbon topoisomerase 1
VPTEQRKVRMGDTCIKTKPEPNCPECGGKMVLRLPRNDQNWSPFWGCKDYPNCRGSVNIDPQTGEPDEGYNDAEDFMFGMGEELF